MALPPQPTTGSGGRAAPSPEVTEGNLVLSLRGITKRFAGVTALDDVDFELRRGEVHVLVGENGAGKSTLAHIIAGSLSPDGGTIMVDGEFVRHQSRHHAQKQGIQAVFQEFSLVPTLTVRENLFLGREPTTLGFVRKRQLRGAAGGALANLGFRIDPSRLVSSIRRSEQQMVEIAKATMEVPRVLLLDEPTSALSDSEAQRLFEVVSELRSNGVGIVYITHRMREIRELGDRATVLRDGRLIGTVNVDEVSDDRLVEMMVGRAVDDLFPTIPERSGDFALQVSGLTTTSGSINDVSLTVRRGEIVGVAGLAGSGKGEIARALMGLAPLRSGEIRVGDESVPHPTPRRMLRRGVCYLPGDRRVEGLIMPRRVSENLSLASLSTEQYATRGGLLRLRQERQAVRTMADRMRIRRSALGAPVSVLSGGNQQKVLFGRAILRDLDVFVLEDPTNGIDVGARAEIYRQLRDLCEAGCAVLLISSDLPEILHLAHRAYVVSVGRVVAELARRELNETAVVSRFFGLDVIPNPDGGSKRV